MGIISIATVAATVFFLMESMNVGHHWKTSMNVGALVTLVAAVHYFYMREFWVQIGTSPIVYRYIDWSITVPLQMIEFYLILSAVQPVREVILQHYEIDCHRWLVHLPSGLLLRLLDGRCERRCSEPGVQPSRFRQQDWVLLGHLAGRQGRHNGENQQGEAAWLRRGCVRSLHRPIAQRRVRST